MGLDEGDLHGVIWRLVGMRDDAGALVPVLGDVVITAFFDEEDRGSGSSGCSRRTAPDGTGIAVSSASRPRLFANGFRWAPTRELHPKSPRMTIVEKRGVHKPPFLCHS